MTQPTFHALCNATSMVLILLGWAAIRGRGPFGARGKDERLHRNFMLGALTASAAFLASYLDYHADVGSVPFTGAGWTRTVYFVVLWPHVVFAAVMVPMIVVTVVAAFRGRLDRHRALARWTLPIWLYVSASGVLVYWMLYHWVPPAT